jgi:hypothetical protein
MICLYCLFWAFTGVGVLGTVSLIVSAFYLSKGWSIRWYHYVLSILYIEIQIPSFGNSAISFS